MVRCIYLDVYFICELTILGYRDIGQVWREELEIPGLRTITGQLMAEVRPFYQILHGVLRRVLWNRVHKFETAFAKNQTIPAHLLGTVFKFHFCP